MISKRVQLQASIHEEKLEPSIVISVNGDTVRDISLLFILLKEELTESIELILNNITLYLSINKDTVYSSCSYFDVKKKKFKGLISMNMLKYMVLFLLKYYRDEVDEVDHIDLDFQYGNDREVTLTLKLDSFSAMSVDEANKLIGG